MPKNKKVSENLKRYPQKKFWEKPDGGGGNLNQEIIARQPKKKCMRQFASNQLMREGQTALFSWASRYFVPTTAPAGHAIVNAADDEYFNFKN